MMANNRCVRTAQFLSLFRSHLRLLRNDNSGACGDALQILRYLPVLAGVSRPRQGCIVTFSDCSLSLLPFALLVAALLIIASSVPLPMAWLWYPNAVRMQAAYDRNITAFPCDGKGHLALFFATELVRPLLSVCNSVGMFSCRWTLLCLSLPHALCSRNRMRSSVCVALPFSEEQERAFTPAVTVEVSVS